MKKEANFSLIFRHWIMANPPKISATYEIKQTSIDSIPFSCLENHQIDASMAVKWSSKGYLIRVESGTVGAPDFSYYYNSPAYIVIKYPKCFCIIDIESFTEEKKRSKRKSLTSERACAISYKVISL